MHAVASDGEFWTQKTLKAIDRLEKDSKHVSLLEENTQEDAAAARGICSQLHELPSANSAAQGAELLLSGMALYQLCATRENSEDEEGDSGSLQSCIDSAKLAFLSPSPKKSKKCKKERASVSAVDADPSSPPPIDVFVDAIIGFLEKSSSTSGLLRTVGKQAFSLLSGMVQESTVDLILSQLERKTTAELLADDEDDEMDVDEDDDVEGGDKDEDEYEDEDSDDDVLEDDEDLEGEEEDLELRRKIEEALRINGIAAATGESDDESEEELMDDDQMMAIDEQLAEVFRSQKRTGKDMNAQREATHFKNRVLDLVDIYLSREPQNPLSLRFVLPLVDLVSSTGVDERQLEDKAVGLVRSRLGRAKDVPTDVGQEWATSSLCDLHGRARKAKSPNMVSVLSVCALYIARVLMHVNQTEAVTSVYRGSLQDFVQRKNSSLNTAFFQDFIRRLPTAAWALRNDFVDLTEEAANVYRRCQAFHLVQILLGSVPTLNVPESEATEYMTRLSKSLSFFFTRACKNEIVLTSAQMKDLLKLALVAVRQTTRVLAASGATSRMTEIWDKDAWAEVSAQLAASERFKAATSLKSMCTQISQSLEGKTKASSKAEKAKKGIPAAAEPVEEETKPAGKQKAAKRKAEQVNGKEPSSSKKKLKQK